MDQRAVQQEEALVLESLFGPDLVFVKTENCWKKWAPLEACINLKPSTESLSKVFVSVQLLFSCAEDYPDSVPNIKITKCDGLSPVEENQIVEMLKKKAETMIGSQMIFELCQTCQEYLETLNAQPKESIHEVMVKKQEMLQQERIRIRADSEMREHEEVEQENERRKNEVENRKQEEELQRQNMAKALNFGEIHEFLSVKNLLGEDIKIYKKTNNLVQRRKPIHRFCTEWSGFEHSQELLVSEWNFVHTLGRKGARRPEVDLKPFADKLEKFVSNVTSTLKKMGEMDQFLYPYVFVHLKKTSIELTNFNVSILIGQAVDKNDRCVSESFSHIQKNLESLITSMASQIVCALKWIHDRQLSHGNLVASSVWMTKKSSFRLSDAFVFPELLKLCSTFEEMVEKTHGSPPNSPSNKSGKAKLLEAQRKDIFSLGTLLDSLSMKPSSASGDEASEFTSTLHNFIKFCQSAKSIEQLVDHKFLSLYLLPFNHLNDSSADTSSAFGFSQLEHSRLAKDFYAFRMLGRGGFGNVFLARNKLDGNDYAVKVIPLNAENEQIIKKVTREANLLSKLNHEHVVRYYAAWFETMNSETSQMSSKSKMDSFTSSSTKRKRSNEDDSEVIFADGSSASFQAVEESDEESSVGFGPGRLWQRVVSSTPKSKVQTIFSPINFASKSGVNSEFDVIFDEDDDEHSENEEGDEDETGDHVSLPKVLFIQMEFCEKSTLRVLIDSGSLLTNTPMNWRLFREILSGLQYIHEHGMIHRDIKPVNIFLDANMSVKIGDFGLATLELFSKADNEQVDPSVINNISGQTKDIGTGLYIAPEVVNNSAYSKKTYDSRCDVYSVGVVLFEMFYRPLPLGMERLEILQHLRNGQIFPDDFGENLSKIAKERLKKLISWMTNLNPEDRPKIRDLLEHELVPFFESEESDFQKKHKENLRNRNTKLYQHILSGFFSLEMPSAADYLYDNVIIQDPDFLEVRRQEAISQIAEELKVVFHLHGFYELNNHIFTPAHLTQNSQTKSRPFAVLEQAGFVVSACPDLRTNFARYCARNAVEYMKRFSIGKILSAADCPGTHPTERVECAADIVAPLSASSKVAAEMIFMIVELQKNLRILSGLKQTIRLGHSRLLESICANHGCSDSTTMRQIRDCLHSMTTGISKKRSAEDKAYCLGIAAEISQSTAMAIVKMIEPADTFEELKSRMQKLLKHKSKEVSDPAKIAIDEIYQLLTELSVLVPDKVSVEFDPGLAYRPNMFSDGLLYLSQVAIPMKGVMKKTFVFGGGRYDSFLMCERHMKDAIVSPLAAYGLNISIESLLGIQQALELPPPSVCRALIYALSPAAEKEAVEFVKELRQSGISSSIYHGFASAADALLAYCKATAIPYLLTISSDHKVVFYEDINLTKSSKRATYGDYAQSKMSKEDALKVIANTENQSPMVNAPPIHESVASVEPTRLSLPPSMASFGNISVTFAMVDKPAHNGKKRMESQVRAVLQEVVQNFNSKTKLEVFVCDLQPELLLQIIGAVNRRFNDEELIAAFLPLMAGRQKRELESLKDHLLPLFSGNNSTMNPIILWSRPVDSYYKVIM